MADCCSEFIKKCLEVFWSDYMDGSEQLRRMSLMQRPGKLQGSISAVGYPLPAR